MQAHTPPPMPGLSLGFEYAVRPPLEEVRRALRGWATPPSGTRSGPARFLELAPPGACLELARLLHDAGDWGALTAGAFSPEERTILELVAATYPPPGEAASGSDLDFALDDLLADSGLLPMPRAR